MLIHFHFSACNCFVSGVLAALLHLKTGRPTAIQLYTHQTVRQQGGTGEDGHIHLADWTLSVAAIEKKLKLRI